MPKTVKDAPQTLQELVSSIAFQVEGTGQYDRFKMMYQDDRIAFLYDVMPDAAKTITPYQLEILGMYDSGINRIAVRGPHGLGKTWLASVLVHHAILTSTTDAKVPTTASAWRQLEKYLWPEIRKSARNIAWPRVGRPAYDQRTEFLSLSIKLYGEDVEAFALASDDHTSLEGAHATRMLFVFDEAKTIPAPTWDAVEGAFSTEGIAGAVVQAFAISTPGDPSGRFYDIHTHKPGYEDWTVRHVTVEEVIAAGRMTEEWRAQRARQWGEESAVYLNRVLGEFADTSEEGVIPLSWVRAANDRWRQWRASGVEDPPGIRTLGVDVARMGQDVTCFAIRNGMVLLKVVAFPKNRTTVTAGLVAAHSGDDRVAHIEGDALGSAVYDILQEQGKRNVRLIVPSGKCTLRDKTNSFSFANNRSAMWWNMREVLDPELGSEVALPPHPTLISDLITPGYEIRANGVIQVESKDSIKKRIGRSTDFGDACCLAFFRASSGGGIVF